MQNPNEKPDDGREDPGDIQRPQAPDDQSPDRDVIEKTLPRKADESAKERAE